MRDQDVFHKTDEGRAEIQHRQRRLAPQLRTILLMVDGQRSVAELRAVMAGVRAPDDTLLQLQTMGLIETVAAGFGPGALLQAVSPSTMPAVDAAVAASVVAEEIVAPAAVGDYHRLYDGMSEAIRAHLGLRGYFMQLKVERCEDAVALRALLPELRQALVKAKGEGFAEQWVQATVRA